MYNFNFKCPAKSKAEATQKMEAFALMAGQLDGPTLKALATKVPSVMANPNQSSMIKGFLGIK